METKIISIIIATYNAGKTLSRCLESIRQQKTNNVELLILDAASSDDTMHIVQRYNDIVDVVIHEKDKGIYDAWNKGIAKVSGEWIMFVGADDLLANGAIERYLQEIDSNHISNVKFDYICSKVQIINGSGKFIKVIGTDYNWNKYRRFMNVAHVGSLHSTNLFKTVGLYNLDYKICADYELLMRKGSQLKVHFVDNISAYMQIGGMSFSKRALQEARDIKIKTGKRLKTVCYAEYFVQLLLFFKSKFLWQK